MEFDLLDQLVVDTEAPVKVERVTVCHHARITFESTYKICEDCGVILNKEDMSFDREWRYYGSNDSKHGSDPNRCHARKNDEKTIFKDVEKLGFSNKIIMLANDLYDSVVQGKIYRGSSRRGIIFACIFHSYKLCGNAQSCEHLIQIFQIDRKVGLKGLKFVNLNAPKDSAFRRYQITTQDLIIEIMNKFHATESQKQEILDWFSRIQNRSSLLNRSRPQSVACGMVRFYIERKQADISMPIFLSKVNLSELTIHKLVDEIERVFDLVNLTRESVVPPV